MADSTYGSPTSAILVLTLLVSLAILIVWVTESAQLFHNRSVRRFYVRWSVSNWRRQTARPGVQAMAKDPIAIHLASVAQLCDEMTQALNILTVTGSESEDGK